VDHRCRNLARGDRAPHAGLDVREVLVTDNGELRGALADTDIIVLAIASGLKPSTITAVECALPHTPRLDADQSTGQALDYMRHRELRRVPVVDGDQLVGSAWIADLAIAAAPSTPQPAVAKRPLRRAPSLVRPVPPGSGSHRRI